MKQCWHHEGPGHDCAYVDARNRLIPLAEKAVLTEMGDEPEDGYRRTMWRAEYTERFANEMERRWRTQGLRVVEAL